MSLLSGKVRKLLKLTVVSAMVMLLSVSAVVASSNAVNDQYVDATTVTIGGNTILPAGAGHTINVPISFSIDSVIQTAPDPLIIWQIDFRFYFDMAQFDYVEVAPGPDYTAFTNLTTTQTANYYWDWDPASNEVHVVYRYQYDNSTPQIFDDFLNDIGGVGNTLTPFYVVLETNAGATAGTAFDFNINTIFKGSYFGEDMPQSNSLFAFSGTFQAPYDITFASDAPAGSVPPSETHPEGSDVTLPGNPNGLAVDGYLFYGWTDQAPSSGNDWYFDTNGEAGGTALASPYTMPGGNVTLYAVWYLAPADPTPVPDGGTPQTGDNTPIALMLGMFGFGVVLLILLFTWRKRNHSENHTAS